MKSWTKFARNFAVVPVFLHRSYGSFFIAFFGESFTFVHSCLCLLVLSKKLFYNIYIKERS